MSINKKHSRALKLMICAIVLSLALPAAAFGATEGGYTIEFRYLEGDTEVTVPDTYTVLGREYKLVSKQAPVLESTLPVTRTYTYKINGALSAEDMKIIAGDPSLQLQPVYETRDREADIIVKEQGLKNNDVTYIEENYNDRAFAVSAEDQAAGITGRSAFKVAGVQFKVTSRSNIGPGLPLSYEAEIAYRGLEYYNALVYYTLAKEYTRDENAGNVNQYVVVATYEPADKKDETTPVITDKPDATGSDKGTGAGTGTDAGTAAGTGAGTGTATGTGATDGTAAGSGAGGNGETGGADGTADGDGTADETTAEPEVVGIPDEDIPLIDSQTGDVVNDIANGDVPLGSPEVSGAWSIASLLLSAAAVLIAMTTIVQTVIEKAGAMQSEASQKKNKLAVLAAKAATTFLGIATLLVWTIIDNFSTSNPYVWVNQNTLIVAIIFALTAAAFIIKGRLASENSMGEAD
jgi:hypothetical protein